MDISAKFMGFDIQSPVIAGSCSKTGNLDNIKRLEDKGIGAVILNSLFEEQISKENSNNMRLIHDAGDMREAYNFISSKTDIQPISEYLELIRKAKESTNIPIIASINCISTNEWMQFATDIQQAGANGLELNMFTLPVDVYISAEEIECLYEDTIQIIRRAVSIPISLKISSYSASLAKLCQKLSYMGISNLSIFNRFIQHDIDINKEEFIPTNFLSDEKEIYKTISWTAVLSNLINCSLSASGGVHSPEDVIKLLLVGASTVQLRSVLFTQGFDFVQQANDYLKSWMQNKGYQKLNAFKGHMAIQKNSTASAFFRVQYMKYYSDVEQ